MAKMQLGDMVAELQKRGFDGFDSGDLKRYINFGYRTIGRLTKWQWEQADLTQTVTPPAYRLVLATDLPTVKSVRAVVCTTSTYEAQLDAISDDDFYANWAGLDLTASQNRGEPDRYWLGAQHLYFLPAPISARSYVITAEQYMAELNDTNTVLVTPEEYDEAVLLASEVHCHIRARQPQFADVNRKLLEDFFDDSISDETTRMSDRYERVVPGRTQL